MEIDSYERNITNTTTIYEYVSSIYNLTQEDSNWIVTSSFIIFTMQTGFGMLESGCVSLKNEVNIMMKNVVDIVLGGLTYWLFGFGISFGLNKPTNPFAGSGGFLIDPPVGSELMGPICAAFLFQLSFATTSTTIVSGAMAERCNFKAYCLFSFLNTIVYCIPAGWVWGDHGFLKSLGVVDIAGSGPVHLVGGVSALACAIMLGPRLGRYDFGIEPLPLGCPVNAIMGLFVLWWGWLAFNSGSTYGVSGQRWQYAARAAVSTMMASMGGGLVGLGFSLTNPNGIDILSQINGILGALVAVTGGCFLYCAWEAIIIGMIGGFITCFMMPILDRIHIDDPVGASATHGASGVWGVIAIGLFADNPYPLGTTSGRSGLFKGGGWYLLGVQSLSVLCLSSWSFITSIILLWLIDKILPIRMKEDEELLGADLVEHRIRHMQIGVSRAMSAFDSSKLVDTLSKVNPVGINPGHNSYITKKQRKGNLININSLGIKKKSLNSPIHAVTNSMAPIRNMSSHLAWIN
ncbi:putative ammonium transporter 3 [Polistes fuscatus]|uniref:putative ammonium transporter 3 n=1 Tax=Polistes fuscatus TaxID=30207 RepID=UPI001CA8A1BA|nr:putative ammonium transporter 3 [Polistes fuscatus]